MKKHIKSLDEFLVKHPSDPLYLTPIKRTLFSGPNITLLGAFLASTLDHKLNKNDEVYGTTCHVCSPTLKSNQIVSDAVDNFNELLNQRKKFFKTIPDLNKIFKTTGKIRLEGKISLKGADKKVFGRFIQDQPPTLNQTEYVFWKDVISMCEDNVFYDKGQLFFETEEYLTLFILKYGASLKNG